jgi:hypothetical protein
VNKSRSVLRDNTPINKEYIMQMASKQRDHITKDMFKDDEEVINYED